MGHQEEGLYLHVQGAHKWDQLLAVQPRRSLDCVGWRGRISQGYLPAFLPNAFVALANDHLMCVSKWLSGWSQKTPFVPKHWISDEKRNPLKPLECVLQLHHEKIKWEFSFPELLFICVVFCFSCGTSLQGNCCKISSSTEDQWTQSNSTQMNSSWHQEAQTEQSSSGTLKHSS